MTRLDPEVPVEVLDDDGVWRLGSAFFRQRLADGWWYHVRLYLPPGYVRELFVRYPDRVKQREE